MKTLLEVSRTYLPSVFKGCPYSGVVEEKNVTFTNKNYFPFLSTGCYKLKIQALPTPNSKIILAGIVEFEIQSSMREI